MTVPSWLPVEDLGLTALVCAFSTLAVWVPFYRGLRICMRARAATRRLKNAELRQEAVRTRVEPLALVMLRVLRKSLRENAQGGYPSEFVLDASKQYVVNEYEAHYSRLISMYANLLPPIGFIGTTGGLLILFVSMHLSDDSLELGALAIALTSSIFALIGFSILEGSKIKLYGRLLTCLDHVTFLQRSADEERAARRRAPAAAGAAGAAGAGR